MQASKEEDELEVDELAGGVGAAGSEEAASAGAAARGQGNDPASNSMHTDEDDGDSKTANAAAAALMHASASKPPSPETAQNAHAATSISGATSASNQTAGDDSNTHTTGPECANCHTQTTSLWRRSAEGQTLCNACSLYQKMKGMPRPVSLKTDVIKHRNRSKGERKKGGPAATTAAAGGEGGGPGAGASGSPGQAKKARQASVAPSKASAIREETMEEDVEASSQSTDVNTPSSSAANAVPPRYPSNSHPSYEQLSASLAHKSRNPYDYTSVSRRPYGSSNIASNSNSPYHHIANATAFGIPPMHLGSSARRTASVGAPVPGGGSKSTSPVANGSANEDKDASRAKEFAAALALAGASGSTSTTANNTQNQAASAAAAAARRSISVDGRSTPNATQTHANPLPWNIASYFSGVAERERQARAAAAALVAHSAAGTSTTSNPASATASTSTSRHGTMPNSATSSATASPTGESKLQYHAQQQQPSGSDGLPFHPHPHANFLAAYRARQQAASLKRDQLAKEASSAGKGKEATTNSGKPEAIMAGPKEWSPVVVGPRGDPRLAALGSGSAAGAIASAAAAAGIPPSALAGMTVDQIRAAIMLGWRISPHASPANSPTIKAATHPHSTPAQHPSHPGAGRSASTSASRQGSRANSRAGSRQNSPPAMSLGGPARNSLGLAAYYNRSVSTDRLSTHPYNRTTSATHPSSALGTHKDALSEEDREKQRQRLEQLFQAAGQRLSAYSNASPATKARVQQDSGTDLGSAQVSADAATASAAGRTPANIHHPSYRPYDLPHGHRSSSKSGFGQPGEFKSTSSARVSPTSLASEGGIGLTAAEKSANRIHRPASAASVSSSAESNADAASMAQKHDVPGITSPNLNAQLSPIFHGVQSRLAGHALADENMAIDEAEEEALDITGGLDAHSNLDSHSPPFGVAFSSIPGGITGRAGDERRGRSTTRKPNGTLDDAALEHHGDHVAHELGALRMRDSSRASSAHRESRPSSPDGYRQYAMEQSARLPHAILPSQAQGKYPRSSIPVSELDDGIVRNALTHRPISDLRASASPHPTLPSLSEALSSSGSSRSMSASQAGSSRHSSNTRSGLSYHHPHGLQEDMASGTGGMLPPPHAGFDEANRLRTRVQELEFINSLMEARVSELESTIALNADKMIAAAAAPHGPECACRCSEIDAESSKAAEHLKKELLTHGVGHIGEKASRDLLDLLSQRLGYHSASPSNSRGPSPNGPGVATASV